MALTNAEQLRQWRASHPERARVTGRQGQAQWREANPDQSREINRRSREKLKTEVFSHYGHSCACCGATENLTIDHVNGDGGEHRAEIGGGWNVYAWLRANNFPEEFQALCRPCNASKKRGTECRLNHSAVAA